MALFSFRHTVKTFSEKRTNDARQARLGQTAAHIRYITRKSAASAVLRERLPSPTDDETARSVEASAERRKGRVCERFIVALPLEASHEQRVALARALAEKLTKGNAGYIVAIHDMSGNDKANPHAHFVLFDKHEKTGGRGRPRSAIGMARKGAIEQAAHGWARLHNTMMTKWGFGTASMIDARSFALRGIDRIPTIHEGAASRQIEVKQVKSEWERVDAGQSRADANKIIREINQAQEEIAHHAERSDGLGSSHERDRERSYGSSEERGTNTRRRSKASRSSKPPFVPNGTPGKSFERDRDTAARRATNARAGNYASDLKASPATAPPFLLPRDRLHRRNGVRRVFRELVMLRDTLCARLLRMQAPSRAQSVPPPNCKKQSPKRRTKKQFTTNSKQR